MTRRDRLLGDLDIGRSTGLEIGALNAPLVTRSESRIRYVDYAETEVVRANRNDPAIDPETIVEVDIVWGERPLVEAVGEQVDYVVASHVIEHVPDLIGWLDELAAVLKPGGTLGLAVPDRRFTFDRLRNDTTAADAIEAWLEHRRRPPPRQIFDVAHHSAPAVPEALWDGVDARPSAETLRAQLQGGYAIAKGVHAQPRYVDIHCWVFTPASFLQLAEDLAALGHFPFVIQAFLPTERGAIEFHVRLTPCADPSDPKILASIAAATLSLRDAPAPFAAPMVPSAQAEALRAEAETLRGEVERLGIELVAARADAEALRAQAEAYRRSTSWRITAPVRALFRLLKR